MMMINNLHTANVPKEVSLNVAQHFYLMAERIPQQIAIVEGVREISYQDLQEEVLKTVAYLVKKGIKKGDRVLVFVPVSISLYRIVLALFHIGAVAVFLDEWSSRERLRQACLIADCKGFIGNWKAKVFGIFLKPLRRIPIWLSTRQQNKEVVETRPSDVCAEDTALITFTTGSTGVPKAANRSHMMLSAQMDALQEKLDPKIGQIDMPALPIFVFLNLGTGLTSILPDANLRKPGSLKPAHIVKQLQAHKVERIIASPFLFKQVAQYLVENKLQLPSLKKVYTGGAPVFPQDAKLLLDGFGDKVEIEAVYGSTEAEPISSLPAADLAKAVITKGLPVGKIFHKTSLQIMAIQDKPVLSSDFESLILGTNQVGEIVVAGDHVLKDYFKNPEAILRNKVNCNNKVWHRTGDAGYQDENGDLFLVGRCGQMIYRDGVFYSPFLYEYLLQQLEGVSAGTIIEVNGEVCAIVEAKNKTVFQKVKELINIENLRVILVAKIPRDARHFSKIDYASLERMVKNNGKSYSSR